MLIRGIVLAGGCSKRMGKNKLAMELGGKPIIKIVIDNAKKSKLDEVVVVYGKYDINTDVTKIYNPYYEDGMSTSLIAGMKGFRGNAVMILLGDMPYVDSDLINTLYDEFENSNKNIVVPIFNNRRGNPVVIGKKYFNNIFSNSGDKGARDIIKNNTDDIEYVYVKNQGVLLDIDDEKNYEYALNVDSKLRINSENI